MSPARLSKDEQRQRLRERVLRRYDRWTHARRHDLVTALRGAVVTLSEAAQATGIPAGELRTWLDWFARSGADGLRVSSTVGRRRTIERDVA